jgi:hypothetical protein
MEGALPGKAIKLLDAAAAAGTRGFSVPLHAHRSIPELTDATSSS